MVETLWIAAAFLAAIFQGFRFLTNEYFKVKSLHIVCWMQFLSVLALLPFSFVIPWPQDPIYYLLIIPATAFFAVLQLYTMGLAAKNGAGVVSRIESLAVGGTFIVWIIVSPSLIGDYLNNIYVSLGIMAAVIGGIYFSLRLKKCSVSFETMLILLPLIAFDAVAIVMTKMAMDHSSLYGGVFYYPILRGITALCVYAVMTKVKIFKKHIPDFGMSSDFMNKRVFMAGFIAMLMNVSYLFANYYALSLVSNPAYVGMIILTTPVWISLIYFLFRRRDQTDVVSGLGLVGCAVLLIYCAQI